MLFSTRVFFPTVLDRVWIGGHCKSLAKLKVYLRDTNQLDRIVDYAERGAMLYRQNGNPEAAAQLLEKAAKILEAKHPDKALTLYIHAAETVGTEGRDKEAAELLTKVAKLQVKQKMWDKAKGNVQGGLYFGRKFCLEVFFAEPLLLL